MNCLLQFDSSAEVVAGGIKSCISSKDHSIVLERVDMLLKVNPEAAHHRFDSSQRNLLHVAVARMLPSTLCIDIMKRILVLHPDAVKEVSSSGELPVHIAAEYSSLDVLKFLLGLYPESATIVTAQKSENLLHLAVSYSSDKTAKEVTIRYLCSRYPEFIHQRNNDGETPFLRAIHNRYITSRGMLALKILCEIDGGQELVRTPIILPTTTDGQNSANGWLPLHIFISSGVLKKPICCSPLSAEADFFRLLLRWYPEAAGVQSGSGASTKTPYQLAVRRGLDPYYLRLLLRAAPTLKPAELHRLNYKERRMAMFMAFRAITAEPTPLLLARLRFENKDLVKHVVSFL